MKTNDSCDHPLLSLVVGPSWVKTEDYQVYVCQSCFALLAVKFELFRRVVQEHMERKN